MNPQKHHEEWICEDLSHMTFPGHLTDCNRQDTQRAVDYITRQRRIHPFYPLKKMICFAQTSVLKMGIFQKPTIFCSQIFTSHWHLLMTSQYPFINENPPSPRRGDKPWHQEQFGDPNDFRSGFPFGKWWYCFIVHMDLSENHVPHWIGLRENLQETMVFTIKYRAFL